MLPCLHYVFTFCYCTIFLSHSLELLFLKRVCEYLLLKNPKPRSPTAILIDFLHHSAIVFSLFAFKNPIKNVRNSSNCKNASITLVSLMACFLKTCSFSGGIPESLDAICMFRGLVQSLKNTAMKNKIYW